MCDNTTLLVKNILEIHILIVLNIFTINKYIINVRFYTIVIKFKMDRPLCVVVEAFADEYGLDSKDLKVTRNPYDSFPHKKLSDCIKEYSVDENEQQDKYYITHYLGDLFLCKNSDNHSKNLTVFFDCITKDYVEEFVLDVESGASGGNWNEIEDKILIYIVTLLQEDRTNNEHKTALVGILKSLYSKKFDDCDEYNTPVAQERRERRG